MAVLCIIVSILCHFCVKSCEYCVVLCVFCIYLVILGGDTRPSVNMPGYASRIGGSKIGVRIRVPSWRPKLTSRYASRMSYLLRYVPGGRVGGVGWCVDTRPSVYMFGYASQCQYVGIRVPVSICGDTRPSVNMCQFCVNSVSNCVNMCVFV